MMDRNSMARRAWLRSVGWGAKAVDRLVTASVDALYQLPPSFRKYGQLLTRERSNPAASARPESSRARLLPAWAKKYKGGPINRSLPVAPLSLPRDLAAHDWSKTEWWYYTGHLGSDDGRRFGFEITFFTYRLTFEDGYPLSEVIPLTAVMGHFAVVDEDTGSHRTGIIMGPEIGTSEISRRQYQLRFGTWKARGGEKNQRIFAETTNLKLSLELEARKPPVLHGGDGIVMKDEGLANYYLSITRLAAQGRLELDGESIPVRGEAWFDREFGFMGDAAVKGWDWLCLQLDDDTELMVYAIRDEAGRLLKESRACFIDAQGSERIIPYSEIELEVLDRWRSPLTGAEYPSGWRIVISDWRVDLTVTPTVADQEFTKGPLPYWEGSCAVAGSHQGRAFVELVGYGLGWGQKWLKLLKKPEQEKPGSSGP